MFTMHTELPRIAAVEALPEKRLRIHWKGGDRVEVDMTGLIARSRHFKALDDDALFKTAEVVGMGTGVGWENGLDISAVKLAKMAEAQEPLTGSDLDDWIGRRGIKRSEAAAILGTTDRTIRNWINKSGEPLPRYVMLAVRALDEEPSNFDALFRPRDGRGRRRKATADNNAAA